jgi:5,10-methylenetetrahydromethanopterin reductase
MIGFELLTFAPVSFNDMTALAQRGEDLGYDRVYTSESLTDTLAVDMSILTRTERIVAVSAVSVIYLRHPLISALSATAMSDVSGGRFVLGLGVGHKVRVEAVGVHPGKPLEDVRAYVGAVRGLFGGERVYPDLPLQTYQGRPLQIRRPSQPVPIHLGAVGPRMTELGGEIADGLILQLVPFSGLAAMRQRIKTGTARAGRDDSEVEMGLIVHTLVADDVELARSKAREALTYWVGLPGYNNSIKSAGYVEEGDAIRAAFLRGDQAGIRAGLTDALLDEFCLLGPPGRCREQLARLRESGVDMPILKPDPVLDGESYGEAVERTLVALAP